MRVVRLVAISWWLQLKMRSRSAFDGLLSILWPLFFATSIFLMFRQGSASGAALLSAAVGASVMGIWSAVSTTAASVLQMQRRLGTLELLVAAPTPFALLLVPVTLSMATIGAYSMIVTVLWGRFVFGIRLAVAGPALFVSSTLVTVVAVAILGFLLAVASVRYRVAWAPGSTLEFPVWLVCGFLVSVTDLPAWAQPISRILAPTWDMAAIHASAQGRNPWGDIAVCLGLAAVYAAIGTFLARMMINSARTPRESGAGMTRTAMSGLTGYRALFRWMTPWIAVPVFIVQPLFQIMLFVYVGRTAGVSDDRFFLIGNAILNAAIPCLFAMGNTIDGKRFQGTLLLLLASPAKRVPLFFDRALPVILNGFAVTVLCLAIGAVLLDVSLPARTWGPLALSVAVSSFSCTGLGLLMAATAMRVRESAVPANVVFGALMIFAGVNVPWRRCPPGFRRRRNGCR